MLWRRGRNLLCLFLAVITILTICPAGVSAVEDSAENSVQATDISRSSRVTGQRGFEMIWTLFDGQLKYGRRTQKNAWFTLESADGIGSLYFVFIQRSAPVTIVNNDTGESRTAGEQLFLHDFVDLVELFGGAPNSVTVEFGEKAVLLAEVMVFTPGEVPDTVQKWNSPADGAADLLLVSAHGDDDQIFFAGVLPYYAVEKDYTVQVVYLTDHHNTMVNRANEMLDGLWACGVRIYPVFGSYPDFVVVDYPEFLKKMGDIGYAYDTFTAQGFPREHLVSDTLTIPSQPRVFPGNIW